jgi:Domain of unknown function (DUF4287)
VTRIEGASPEQEAILEEIFGGIPETRIQTLRVEQEYDLEPEPDEHGNPPADWDPTTPLGDALRLIVPEQPDLRTQWELELVGQAFHARSKAAGLPGVVAVHSFHSGHYFWGDEGRPDEPAPTRDELHGHVEVAAGTTGGLLDRIEFLEPARLAVAVTLAVPEAHAYLRHGLGAFAVLSRLTEHGLAGSFLEIADGEPEPVLQMFGRGGFGAKSNRADVACCAPGGLSRPIVDPGPPPCPFPSRTWADMWDAYRRNLARTTGRELAAWLALLPPKTATDLDRMLWLKREHGLGQATAYAIATADD